MNQPILSVLLDDDSLILASWKLAAREAGIPFLGFASSAELFARIGEFSPSTVFYLDAKLPEGERGEWVAKRLYDSGFRELHLVTGYPPEEFASCIWLKSILAKDPPWKK